MRSPTLLALVICLVAPTATLARKSKKVEPPPVDLSTRWVERSVEHDAVVLQTYAAAHDQVSATASRLPPDTAWAVVADVDETLVDNVGYQLEVAGVGYSAKTWADWEARGEAVALPGSVDFVGRIHRMGGRVAYVTNRRNHDATLALLQTTGLWADGDRLCVRVEDRSKAPRRASVREGTASCGWEGEPMRVLAYLGDQRGDFPAESEEPDDGELRWGRRWFMLPNPMYGDWSRD